MSEFSSGDNFGRADETAMDTEARVEELLNGIQSELPEPADISETDEIAKDLLKDLQSRLKMVGLEEPDKIDEETLETLMEARYMDTDSVEDLYFEVWDYAREKLGPFTRVSQTYLLEGASRIDPSQLQKKQDDQAKCNLINLFGVNADELLDATHDSQKRNIRRLDWLLTKEYTLRDFSVGLKMSTLKGEATTLERVALRVRNTLRDTKECLESTNGDCLNSIDRTEKQAETRRLGYIMALSESVYEGILKAPKAYGSILETQE